MDWWNQAFRAAYLEVYHHRDDAQAAAEVAGLLPRLRRVTGPVIDAACGAGRHLAALRSAGITAFGFDLSGDLLAAAQRRPACGGRLVRGDLRAPPIAGGCGAVLCLFTAFGYFDEAGNAACLDALVALLAPDGLLLLDLPDLERVRATLVPRSTRITPGGWQVVEERRLDGRVVLKSVHATPPQGEAIHWQERVRIYSQAELTGLAAASGLALRECWSSLLGPGCDQGRVVAWLSPLRGSRNA